MGVRGKGLAHLGLEVLDGGLRRGHPLAHAHEVVLERVLLLVRLVRVGLGLG